MKKRLLTLGAIVMYLSLNAQQTVTYIGNNAKLYVSGGALVYSGGVFKVDSEMTKSVENRGNIIIKENYVKGNTGTYGEDGKEFVNIYRGDKEYGQVKILEQSNNTTTARMTIEKPAVSSNYFGASYAIGIPFTDNVKYLMHSFGKQESEFRGDCGIDVDCARRYMMTLTKWNNNKLQHDAVPSNTEFVYGHYYNLNLRGQDMQNVMTAGTIVQYKGKPSGKAYTQTAKGVIHGLSESTFSNLGYNNWKKTRNPYKEAYETYLGYTNTNSKVYSKNVYRFANPYTSNLDLSVVEGDNAWLKIKNNSANGRNIKEAYRDKLVKDFSVRKRATDYDVDWGKIAGGLNATAKYHIAKFDGNTWVGSSEALIIRPMETFNLHFPLVNPKNLGNTRILDIEVKFNDNHKTFAHAPGVATTNSNLHSNPTVLSTMSINGNESGVLFANENNSFNQLEIFLVKNNEIQATPAYIVGTNYYEEEGENATTTNSVYAYGVKENAISYDSKKDVNEFNTLTYIAKPLGVGFNDLKLGESYELRFSLYEKTIFNKVNTLKDGSFFLKDNTLNKIIKIDANSTYSFEANEDVNKRFVVYWKDVPVSTNIIDVVDTPTEISHKTIVYKDSDVNKVRFEGDKESAKVEVYDASGRLVLSKEKLSVDTDYTLNLGTKGMYVIKVIYKNNETRILKLINN